MARIACKFGVIKYIPNSVKQEVINIGIILHSSSQKKLLMKFLDYDPRIRNFVTDVQLAEFKAFRRLFSKHIREQKNEDLDKLLETRLDDDNYLEKLQSSLQSPFILAKPEWVFVENLDTIIDDLYFNLILDPEECRTKQKTLIKQVEERFFTEGLEKYIKRDISVKGLPFNLNIEFGVQIDSKLDLMQPISLQESPRENYKEGVFWRDTILKLHEDAELNAGGFFAIVKPPKNHRRIGFDDLIQQLRSIKDTTVINYDSSEFDRLVHSIKHHGKIISK